MRKIILNLAVSLDSKIEGPNGEYDWCFTDQDYGLSELLNRIDTVFYGRKSYELFGNTAPAENTSSMEKDFFSRMISMKNYVFSKTKKSFEGAEAISENVEETVRQIKQQPGKDIFLFGGAGLITTLVNFDLVDEYILAVHPVILGAGKSLFANISERKNLTLVSSKVYKTGLVILRYLKQ